MNGIRFRINRGSHQIPCGKRVFTKEELFDRVRAADQRMKRERR